MKISVVGAGAWGTAMAQLLATNGHDVRLWCFEEEVVDSIVKHCINKKYFDGIELDKKIKPTTSLHEAIDEADVIFEAVPVAFLREVLEQSKAHIRKDQKWVVLSKGIEEKAFLLPSEIIKDVLGFAPKMAVLSGPNFAAQVAHKDYSETILASFDEVFLQELEGLCTNDFFKVVLSDDPVGAQVAGAVKNVIAILVGLLEGAGYRENTRAALCTRAFSELAKLIGSLGGKVETAYGLAGLGDTILSFVGKKSRNYAIGVRLGAGELLRDLEASHPVFPEGINTLKSLHALMRERQVLSPLFSALYGIVYEGKGVHCLF